MVTVSLLFVLHVYNRTLSPSHLTLLISYNYRRELFLQLYNFPMNVTIVIWNI
jgi:hypothetical protein